MSIPSPWLWIIQLVAASAPLRGLLVAAIVVGLASGDVSAICPHSAVAPRPFTICSALVSLASLRRLAVEGAVGQPLPEPRPGEQSLLLFAHRRLVLLDGGAVDHYLLGSGSRTIHEGFLGGFTRRSAGEGVIPSAVRADAGEGETAQTCRDGTVGKVHGGVGRCGSGL